MSEPREVEIRDVSGEWHRARALSEPRYDRANALRKWGPTFLSVSVIRDGWEHPVNWPADDVREATP
jgi:hypothetical protein